VRSSMGFRNSNHEELLTSRHENGGGWRRGEERRGRPEGGVQSLSKRMSATPAGTRSCWQCPEGDQERLGALLRGAAS